ncbi:MAG TPA: glycosyl hydrolase 115 family protein, partial [Verrucomicrobiae bacterium]|nr:glycosyl hydrolase 115 family protein [Verrucomicrobiae bacterium]
MNAETRDKAEEPKAQPARLIARAATWATSAFQGFERSRILSHLLGLSLALVPWRAPAIGQEKLVETVSATGSFALAQPGSAAVIQVDPADWPGVLRAATDLQTDIAKVTGTRPMLTNSDPPSGSRVIWIGTIGRSRLIEQCVREKQTDVSSISGHWEATLIQTIKHPRPGIESALVIAGSDKRGTIYGIYALSEQMGVSPWYWWADVPVRHRNPLYVSAGPHVLSSPAVKYRGIFLNDEAPALSGWAQAKFGGFNHRFYTNVFELILRLRANFLWPAMWNNSFATDDPLNARLADEYGIVMGTSHHEPMMRAWKEWSRAGNGPHSWDYSKNETQL